MTMSFMSNVNILPKLSFITKTDSSQQVRLTHFNAMFSFYCMFIIWDIIHSDEMQELQMANTSKNKSAKFTLFSKTS